MTRIIITREEAEAAREALRARGERSDFVDAGLVLRGIVINWLALGRVPHRNRIRELQTKPLEELVTTWGITYDLVCAPGLAGPVENETVKEADIIRVMNAAL